jgi:hypothetical protein
MDMMTRDEWFELMSFCEKDPAAADAVHRALTSAISFGRKMQRLRAMLNPAAHVPPRLQLVHSERYLN